MADNQIAIKFNEEDRSVREGVTLAELRDKFKPDADVLVVNGFPSQPDTLLKDGDEVVLIRRGETPKADELEALMVARHTPGVHERMKSAVVGLAGLGGLGSAVAISLARMGIGTMILADFDIVEPSNLNRQHYFIEHIGMPKTEAMAQILSHINPYIQVQTHTVILTPDNIPDIFKAASIVVECFDGAEAKAMIIETVADALPKAFAVGASGLAGYGDSNGIQTRRLGEKIFIVGDLVMAAQPGRGLMAPRVGIAANHQANLVVSLLMDTEAAVKQIPDMLA
ncbi:MAG: sulfur carrier protein ThiS adenylyltransferase ThiF [Desulfobacteraceae bacterium]